MYDVLNKHSEPYCRVATLPYTWNPLPLKLLRYSSVFYHFLVTMRTVTYGHKDLNLVAVTIFKTVYNSLQTLSALQGILSVDL